MNEKTAEELIDFLIDFGSVCTAEVRSGYSGRGMYGKQTTAITLDCHPERAIGMLVVAQESDEINTDYPSLRSVKVNRLRYDQMGLDYILYEF